jgi:sulfite exporter TauE/SafE
MCGGFALTIGVHSDRMRANLRRQAVYSAGRVMTYVFCGAIAGVAGMRLARSAVSLVNMQSVLAIVAGLLLVWQGLRASGWRFPGLRAQAAPAAPCLAGSALRTFLTAPDLTSVFLAGLMTGFLPCGLVYAHLALASASGGLASGIATMGAFGAGTVPLMVVTGLGSRLLPLAARRRLLTWAACCVVITGALSIYRGAAAIVRSQEAGAPRCPHCAPPTQASTRPANRDTM